MAAERLFVFVFFTCSCFHVGRSNLLRLFDAGSPNFVNVSDVRQSVRTLVNNVADRMLCEEHGLQHTECIKCLDVDNILSLLKLTPKSKSMSRKNAEDMAIFFTHQILYFESMCIRRLKGCRDIHDCQEEISAIMGRFSSSTESLVKVLRIFKLYLREGNDKKCFSAEDVLEQIPASHDPASDTRRMLTLVMGRIFKGSCIEIGESVTDFLDDIFHHYSDSCSPYMSLNGLKRMIDDLQSGQGNDHDHSQHHSHHHDNNHIDNHECDHQHAHFAHYHDHSHNDHGDHIHHDHDEADHLNYEHYHPQTNHHHHIPLVPLFHLEIETNNSNLMNHTEEISTGNSHSSTSDIFTSTEQLTTDKTVPEVSKEYLDSLQRTKRMAPGHKDYSAPSASLRSDLSHSEDHYATTLDPSYPLDDVKKVYLLESDVNNKNIDLELSGTPHQFASLAAKCLSAEDLVQKFGHQENSTLSKNDFIELCPALIQQIVSGVCTDTRPTPPPLPTRSETYGYGTLSVFIISLTSLAGVLLLPVMTKHAYDYIIVFFYGLAFSTLAADALLHLIPQFLGLHSHGGEDHDHSHEGAVLEPYVQMQLGVFFTVYGLFLFETLMGLVTKSGHHHGSTQENKGHGHNHAHSHLSDKLPTLVSVKTKSETQLTPVSRDQSNSSLDTEIMEMEPVKKPPNLMVSKPVFLGMTSLAIVVTLGDSLHNFGDGLAIGAAFSTGVRGGLSTAIAVFCHELPHEFGDFVVLLSTGLSFSRALLINFISGLTCFGGLYLGILIGDNETARQWVMAITAGIFLYVALAEMLPELRENQHGSPWKMLIVKNLGILMGITIMLLLSLYEEQLA